MTRPYKDWSAIYKEWQASGQTKTEFCKQRGHCRKYFQSVCRRFESSPKSDFVRVSLEEPPLAPRPQAVLRITTPSGYVLDLT